MKRSRLCNKFLNTKSDIAPKAYHAQRNLCVSLIRQAKKQFFSNLNTNVVTENKTFWKTLKPFLTDKVKTKSKITLIEKKYEDSSTEPSEEIISDEEKVAEIFNNFFVNVVSNLKILNNHNCNMDFQKTDDPVLNAISKYRYHSSIVMINSKFEPESKFSFTTVQYEDVLRKTKNLNVSKASQQSDIPIKILIENSEYFSLYFHKNIHYCLERSLFPRDLKLADVAPVYKKKSKASKES